MNAANMIYEARILADSIERREQFRHGGNRAEARIRVARKLGMSTGTLYNLARDRLKRLDAELRNRLATYAIADLENEIASLSTDLATARRLGLPESPSLVGKVSAVLAEAQALHSQLCGGQQ
jgi:capsule polysaccharide export protein KpsE/RkpR